jgi:hypothetical protein
MSAKGEILDFLLHEAVCRHGIFSAMAFSTLPDESRVAMPFASGGKIGSALSQPSGKSRRYM